MQAIIFYIIILHDKYAVISVLFLIVLIITDNYNIISVNKHKSLKIYKKKLCTKENVYIILFS